MEGPSRFAQRFGVGSPVVPFRPCYPKPECWEGALHTKPLRPNTRTKGIWGVVFSYYYYPLCIYVYIYVYIHTNTRIVNMYIQASVLSRALRACWEPRFTVRGVVLGLEGFGM